MKEYVRDNLGPSETVNFVSGGLAGICAMTATHPLERVKMMRIFGIKDFQNQSFLSSIRTMARNKGTLSIFRGNMASVIREFPGAGLMFYFYEHFKSISSKHKRPGDPDLPYRVMSGA